MSILEVRKIDRVQVPRLELVFMKRALRSIREIFEHFTNAPKAPVLHSKFRGLMNCFMSIGHFVKFGNVIGIDI